MTLTKIIVDCSTGLSTEVELTTDEISQREADIAAANAQKVIDDVASVKAQSDKAALLTKLGITADEAKLLLS